MNIQKLYEQPAKFRNRLISRFIYKINKGILNIFYPVFARCSYGVDDSSNVIVSLTSFPGRINSVWITITSLLNQTVKPKAIILWLAEDQFPQKESDLPRKLLKLKEKGLTIRFCDNLYPHKKYYYSIREYPDSSVITVDDDIFYPENLVEELTTLHEKYPKCVCCTWAHEITIENGRIRPYAQWKKWIQTGEKPSIAIIPVGCGGVLYPAHSLCEQTFDKEKIRRLAMRTDDLWLKAMEILGGVEAVRWNKKLPIFYSIMRAQKSGLFHENVTENRNDEAMNKIISEYPEISMILESKQ